MRACPPPTRAPGPRCPGSPRPPPRPRAAPRARSPRPAPPGPPGFSGRPGLAGLPVELSGDSPSRPSPGPPPRRPLPPFPARRRWSPAACRGVGGAGRRAWRRAPSCRRAPVGAPVGAACPGGLAGGGRRGAGGAGRPGVPAPGRAARRWRPPSRLRPAPRRAGPRRVLLSAAGHRLSRTGAGSPGRPLAVACPWTCRTGSAPAAPCVPFGRDPAKPPPRAAARACPAEAFPGRRAVPLAAGLFPGCAPRLRASSRPRGLSPPLCPRGTARRLTARARPLASSGAASRVTRAPACNLACWRLSCIDGSFWRSSVCIKQNLVNC